MSSPKPTPVPLFPAEEGRRLKALTAALAQLQTMDLKGLRAEHLRLLGFEARSKNLTYLRRRLAVCLQERVDGGLSELAQARLEALMPDTLPVRRSGQLLLSPPKPKPKAPPAPVRDPRLPAPGTRLQRTFRGEVHEIEVRGEDVLYQGQSFPSLSTVAKAITGTSWNGFLFFNLVARKS